MTTAQWFLLIGGLLLARGATASLLTRLPVTPAIIYLAVGLQQVLSGQRLTGIGAILAHMKRLAGEQ